MEYHDQAHTRLASLPVELTTEIAKHLDLADLTSFLTARGAPVVATAVSHASTSGDSTARLLVFAPQRLDVKVGTGFCGEQHVWLRDAALQGQDLNGESHENDGIDLFFAASHADLVLHSFVLRNGNRCEHRGALSPPHTWLRIGDTLVWNGRGMRVTADKLNKARVLQLLGVST